MYEGLLDGSPWVDVRTLEKAAQAVEDLLDGTQPTYFDMAFLKRTGDCLCRHYFLYDLRYDDEDYGDVERKLIFIRGMTALGGRPSYQLVKAATSGRLRAFYHTFAVEEIDLDSLVPDKEAALAEVERVIDVFCACVAESKSQTQ